MRPGQMARKNRIQLSPCLRILVSSQDGGNAQGVAAGVAEDEEAAGRNQRGQVGVIQKLLGERGGTAADIFFAVGRVGENEIELLTQGGHLGDGGAGVLHAEVEQARGEAGQFEVLPDELGVPAGFFDADGMSGAAAEAFQARARRCRRIIRGRRPRRCAGPGC